MGEPIHRLPHGAGGQRAVHGAPFLFARDEPGVLEYAQVLHEAGQGHAMRSCECRHRTLALGERSEDAPSRRIREGRKNRIQPGC